jgi:hypothetical protein
VRVEELERIRQRAASQVELPPQFPGGPGRLLAACSAGGGERAASRAGQCGTGLLGQLDVISQVLVKLPESCFRVITEGLRCCPVEQAADVNA